MDTEKNEQVKNFAHFSLLSLSFDSHSRLFVIRKQVEQQQQLLKLHFQFTLVAHFPVWLLLLEAPAIRILSTPLAFATATSAWSV